MKITVTERVFHFKQPAGTSRGIYTERHSWFVELTDGNRCGVGECAPLPDLSCDAMPNYGEVLKAKSKVFVFAIEQGSDAVQAFFETLRNYPSMLFGFETALMNFERDGYSQSLTTRCCPQLFNTAFTRGEVGIPINGLVWMGSYEEMLGRIEDKLEEGFRCVKLKVGAIDFLQELDLVKRIRQRFSFHDVELRLDANGGFNPDEALYKLELLSQYAIHSIEQPIKQKQWAFMSALCRDSPLPVALDEELIGVNDPDAKRQMLNIIKPSYIVLKPSLHGGMMGCREWIRIAHEEGLGSWITSALESNVGLNAIAQFCSDVYGDEITFPQGLGTGQLFSDNVEMGLEVRGDKLFITS